MTKLLRIQILKHLGLGIVPAPGIPTSWDLSYDLQVEISLGYMVRYFRKPEAKTSSNIITKDIPADAHNPRTQEAGYLGQVQAISPAIKLIPLQSAVTGMCAMGGSWNPSCLGA